MSSISTSSMFLPPGPGPFLPAMVMPDAPDVLPIVEMHRGHDGFVAFQRREADGGVHPLFSVPAKELASVFPQFVAPHVGEESFFSINGMYRGGFQQSSVEPKFRSAKWGGRELRWLTACYVDIDFYKMGITLGQAIGVVVDAQDRGAIPPASMLTRSGRGLWCWWFLCDDNDPTHPARAWPEACATHRRIERQLLRTFESIEPDKKATDPARITRVPGSLHRKAQVRVGYWIQRDTSGKPFVYKLDDLAVRLGVAPTRLPDGMQRVLNPKLAERAKRGYKALWANRLAKIVKLISKRGKIKEGCRNHCALLLATFMERSKIDATEIEETLWKFGQAQCEPPMLPSEMEEAFNKRRFYTMFSDFTIADWLGITPEESEEIGWPAAGSRTAADDSMLRTRKDARRARRLAVASMVEGKSGRNMPTLQAIAEALEEMGIDTCPKTILKDLQLLGVKNPRARKIDNGDGTALLINPATGEVLAKVPKIDGEGGQCSTV